MTLTTVFVNETTVDFKLKRGNGGVYKEVTTLKGLDVTGATPSGKNEHTLAFDEKATYDEFRISRQGVKIHITSDFCLDHSPIYIVSKDGAPGFDYRGDPRNLKSGQFSLFGTILKLFSRKS